MPAVVDDDPLAVFSPSTRRWFQASFPGPTAIQALGWPVVAAGRHALLVAPTGSGKTLAAFLWGIDRVAGLSPDAGPGVRVLYVSPLKALVYDVERNLRAPLVGVARARGADSPGGRAVAVAVRTGDTPQRERQRQARSPGDILVTTPESLYLILGSRARTTLRTVHTVIVDEVHALAAGKRGAHLALSLERLAEACEVDPQRIGLSATVRPAAVVAGFLGGDREVAVVDAGQPPRLDLRVIVPVPDMERVPEPVPEPRPGGSILGQMFAEEVAPQRTERGIWPALYPRLLDEVRGSGSTILFVNNRGLCERLARRLNELAGEELVRAHHGSVSHDKRSEMEEALKAGRLKGIVATSSLELGIDMGAVDRVLLVESPGSVARGLQRVGRSGHRVEAVSVGRIYPKFRGDLLECAVVARGMLAGTIEALRVPENPLDVLAQQVVAACCQSPRSPAELHRLVTRAYPYRRLGAGALGAVLEMLSGAYPGTELAELRPLLAWDRAADRLTPRRGAELVTRANAGTIPDRGTYPVHVGPDGPRVGELDEEMVFETRAGDNILLGATTWHVEAITRDRVLVSPAPGEPGRLPFWRGEGPGRPVELGEALGRFTAELAGLPAGRAVAWVRAAAPLDALAAENLAAYVREQLEHTGTVPTHRAITVERFRDELGDWRVCILTPFGARLHGPWALALQRGLGREEGVEAQVMYTDDGIVLRLADGETLPRVEDLFPAPDQVEDLVMGQLGDSALFAGLFRENAVRSLLLARRPDRRRPLWVQRLWAKDLLQSVRRYPSFPVVLETVRQALADVFDLPGLKDLLVRVQAGEVRVTEVETPGPSPFARSLVFAYVAAFIYDQDAPVAERRAQALALDRGLLAELLGQAELRDLLDAAVVAELEAELQHTAEGRRAADADSLHDLLRRLGDLTGAELALRAEVDPRPWLDALERQRRVVQVMVAGEPRWIATEDAGLYREALGVVAPGGLPSSVLAAPPDPIRALLARFARTRGPFAAAEAAARFGLTPALLETALAPLEAAGVVLRGEIRPGGAGPEWCDREVLRRLKRRTLSRLRQEVAPVDGAALGVFLPAWQGLGDPRPGMEGLLEAVGRLQGLPLPWSLLVGHLLPARVAGFTLELLDMACATGALVWVGGGAMGPRDGRVALHLRRDAARLLDPPEQAPAGALHRAVLDHLRERGASFYMDLVEAASAACPEHRPEEFRAALWDLVWSGHLTNDTVGPLRALGRGVGGRGLQPLAGGRWWLVETLRQVPPSDTERAVARASVLLERYGVVSREAVAAEGTPGGFGPIYQALKAMEEAGRVQRGHFVEGLSGAQFGALGAVDRLRATRWVEEGEERPVLVLAALDPANPYGALLPWPPTATVQGRPRRVPGAWLILVAGRPALYVSGGGRQVLTFPMPGDETALEAGLGSLHRLPRGARRGLLVVEQVDGLPVLESPLAPLLRRAGFVADYRGMVAGAAPMPLHDHRAGG